LIRTTFGTLGSGVLRARTLLGEILLRDSEYVSCSLQRRFWHPELDVTSAMRGVDISIYAGRIEL